MIILPDRKLYPTKFLMPMEKFYWRTPSQAQRKDRRGNESHTRFKLSAKLHDGDTKWVWWFYDRDDFDAVLWAIANGTFKYEKELWRLPNETYIPKLGYVNNCSFTDLYQNNVNYQFAPQSVTYIGTPGSPGTSNGGGTWTRPRDWNNGNNKIECIGGGASGGAVQGGGGYPGRYATGGGGGAYAKAVNVAYSANQSYYVSTEAMYVDEGGIPATAQGNNGQDTFFGSSSFSTSSVGAKFGSGGRAAYSAGVANQSGGAGGSAASCRGGIGGGITGPGAPYAYSGGRGGNNTVGGSSASISITGGGGAAGPYGNGGNGADNSGVGATGGGNADAGFGGAGGIGGEGTTQPAYTAQCGVSGTEFGGGHGTGGGGGGSSVANASSTGGWCGYDGGGGGAVATYSATGVNYFSTSGGGASGLIVVTYTPASYGFNMPMLGM